MGSLLSASWANGQLKKKKKSTVICFWIWIWNWNLKKKKKKLIYLVAEKNQDKQGPTQDPDSRNVKGSK